MVVLLDLPDEILERIADCTVLQGARFAFTRVATLTHASIRELSGRPLACSCDLEARPHAFHRFDGRAPLSEYLSAR